jgi:hypothetical protein
MSRSLVQRSPADCGCLIVSDLETLTTRWPRPELGCCATEEEYINQLMSIVKHIQAYKIPIKLLHVSASRCHHQGVILTNYKASPLK